MSVMMVQTNFSIFSAKKLETTSTKKKQQNLKETSPE